MSRFAALVLAAGASTRFANGHKLLARFRDKPLVSHVFERAISAPVGARLVVTGARVGEIAALAEAAGLRSLHNPDFATGLSSSLKAGLAALPADCDGVLILLGDMPLIHPETLRAIVLAAEANPAFAAIVPTYRGEWGHPVLLKRALFGDLGLLTGDQGARKLLQSRKDVLTLAVEDPGILADFDTREAFADVEKNQ
ncbi:MAG: nucleotidyltransferase family protein [Rhizobiales bacterium]|jgi:molybdenum cofactor cytidylyltransferase|nr:nucleotidyltransferase family protein [Hyphomicrobiales bacterium]